MLIALLIIAGIVRDIIVHIQRRQLLRPFWERGCMGVRWRRRFPASPKTAMREFLSTVVDAFLFHQTKRCRFSPDDRVMDIYRALYPPGSVADSLELETLALGLAKRYRIDVRALWREDITLGELYEHTRERAA